MARVTVEDCLEQVPNRFALIHLAFQRVKQIRSGDPVRVQSKNKEVVVALREIAAGKVEFPFPPALIMGDDKSLEGGDEQGPKAVST